MEAPFRSYLQTLQTTLAAGRATEHTHRPALKTLLEALKPGIMAVNEPRQEVTECGKPDMVVLKGAVPLGYLETKDIGKSLDTEEKSAQIKRYRQGLPNFILTDYLEFRWYVDGERRARASLGHPENDGKIKARKEDVAALDELLGLFLAHQAPSIGTARELALRMAGLAHLMRDAAFATLETEPETGTLQGWLAAFEKTLLPHLPAAEFADMYAQTLAYGLFAAKVTVGTGQGLRRDTAAALLPETNPFLKKLFYHLAGPEVPPTVSWAIDDMIALLNAADLEAVLADFGRGSLEKDPVVHFYETFLTAYDPKKRRVRGVYYTPEPVVSYIVRAIDHLLRESFSRSWGLADTKTLILDPACGTGTFLHAVIALIYEYLIAQGQAGMWPGETGYVSQKLLPRLFGFELLMAPYAVAHLKLGLALMERGYDFPAGKRLGVYLTNTLEEALKKSQALPLAGFITEESNTAAAIKQDEPIEVILGNPPYFGHSANASTRREVNPATGKERTVKTWIGRMIEDYKQVDGQPLGEKNPKWLQNDYVKFLRWGQWRIDRTGRGILAMITDNSYLDSITRRGMRQALMQSFNEIYLLNLHGNFKKKEVSPDGSPDENVFDETGQGVAIGVFVKRDGGSIPAQVWHADLWGRQEEKYKALAELELTTTPWQELQPHSPYYLFSPQVVDLQAEYERGWPVNEIFPVNSVGIVTARDKLTIRWSPEEVWETVQDFASLPPEVARERYNLGRDVQDWQVPLAQVDLKKSGPDRQKVVPILYRPFDTRFTYYTGHSRGFICRPRSEVMGHILSGENFGLCTSRGTEISGGWEHIFCSKTVIQHHTVSLKEVNYLFPLYLYPQGMFQGDGKAPNLSPGFIEVLSGKLGLIFAQEGQGDLESTIGPEDVFYYVYAVFHAPEYRGRYAELLKVDFPRLPLTGNKALFSALVGKGAELAVLHLMEAPALDSLITSFPVPGSQVVEEVRYEEAAERVYINADQYFEGVPPGGVGLPGGGLSGLAQVA
jgi:hypothetical protein